MGLSVKAPELGLLTWGLIIETGLEAAKPEIGVRSSSISGVWDPGGGVRLLRLKSTGGLALAAGLSGTIKPSILTVFPVLAKIKIFGPS